MNNSKRTSLSGILNNSLLDSTTVQKNQLLEIFCLFFIGLAVLTSAFIILQLILTKQFLIFSWIAIGSALVISLLNYQWAKRGHYQLASWVLIFSFFVVMTIPYIQRGPNSSILLGFLLPIVFAIILLDTKAILLTLGLSSGLNIILHILQDLAKVYVPPAASDKGALSLIDVFIAIVVFPALIALIVIPLQAQTDSLKKQNLQLKQVLNALERRQQRGQQVSQEIWKLSGTLGSNAAQQAASSQQQVAAITQINTSMTELAVSAGQITNLTLNINEAVEAMAANSQQIENTTRLSVQQSQQGKLAVDNTILASQEIAELYHNLTNTLSDLTLKTESSRRILELIGSIANETHLLALNASIEAAGAGIYGERFRIIAQEVKNLADRARRAGQEAVEVVLAIETATTESVRAVGEGFKKAQQMEEVVRLAGTVIEEMQEVAKQAQHQSIEVNQFTQEVKTRVDVVRQVTYQQHTASQQVLRALPDLSTVAQQNAEGSANINEMVLNLEQVSNILVGTLEN